MDEGRIREFSTLALNVLRGKRVTKMEKRGRGSRSIYIIFLWRRGSAPDEDGSDAGCSWSRAAQSYIYERTE